MPFARAIPLIAIALISLHPTQAQQPQPARPPAAAPAPDPALEAAQKAFDALPENERKAIQNDLIWGSDFTATVSGGFGRRTYDAIVSFQKAAKLKPDGILDPAGRKRLAEAAEKARATAKFASVIDPKSGASLGVPQGPLSKRETMATGTRWSTPDGAIQLETAVAAGGAAELAQAFERVVGLQATGRKVTYKLLRPDFFVVAGETGLRSFYTRYGVGPASLRGYTLSYPTAQAKALERYVIAIANAYQPNPGAAPPAAVATAPSSAAPPPPAPETWPPGLVQTGIVVASGRVVTASRIETCTEVMINRKPARILQNDRQAGIALLEADTGGARPLSLTATTGQNIEAPVVVGFAAGGSAATVAVSSGALAPGAGNGPQRIVAPLAREAAGSAVFDRKGAFIGLIAAPERSVRLVAGLVPAASHRLVASSEVARLAQAQTGAGAGDAVLSAGAIAAAARGSLVAIDCAKPSPR